MTFAKAKCIADNYLISMNFNQLNIFRPGYIYPVVPRKEPNISYKIMRFLYPVYKRMFPNGVIASTQLGHAMLISGLKINQNTPVSIKELTDNYIRMNEDEMVTPDPDISDRYQELFADYMKINRRFTPKY